MPKKLFDEKYIKELVSSHSLNYEYAANDWRDGFLLGNGDVAAIAYAPGNREWVINKNDVFDARTYDCDTTPHHEIMKILEETGEKYTYFIDKLEKRRDKISHRSLTPVILRLCNGNGELGWSAPAFPKISETLSIYDGEIVSKSDAHFIHSTVKSIVPHGKRVLAVRLEGTAIADWDNKIELYRPYNEELSDPEYTEFDGGYAFTQNLPENIGKYAVAVLVKMRDGGSQRVTYELPCDFDFSSRKQYVGKMSHGKLSSYLYAGGDVDIFVAVSSDYSEKNPLESAIANVKAAADMGFETLEAENAAWWHKYWEKAMVDFGKNSDFQKYWLFSMYALAASFGSQPMPALSGMLYGPLSPTVPGVNSHHYNTDQNIQIPLMPVPIVNHSELIIPYVDTFLENAGAMREYTKQIFAKTGGRGIFVPLVMNQNGVELNSGSYRYTMCGSAYSGLILARCWEYTHDDELMREKLYPLLSEFVRFYADNMLHLGKDGIYHLDPTVPPEIFMFTKDDTATVSMLKACMRIALLWCEKEGIENEETKYWQDILAHYPTVAKRRDGSYIGGPDIPEDYFAFGTHQLYPFFPSEEYLSQKEREYARKTIENIDNEAIERTYSGECGWHFIHGWSWFLYYGTLLHLGEGELVWKKLSDFLRFFAKRNGLFIHNSVIEISSAESERNHKETKPPEKITADMTTSPSWYGVKCSTPHSFSKELTAPVIEGGSIFVQLATETLIQSFDGVIRLFPAVPDDFSGAFFNLYAKGGILVSAKMEQGKIVYASFTAKQSTSVKLLASGLGDFDKSLAHIGEYICFDIAAGETVELKK